MKDFDFSCSFLSVFEGAEVEIDAFIGVIYRIVTFYTGMVIELPGVHMKRIKKTLRPK